jgi:tRNA threonylcarbamoyladenosine modification (KEOPS) complex Cgi121 subunit
MNVKRLFRKIQDTLQDTVVQLFDARKIAGWEHIYFAALNSLKVCAENKNISNSIAIETLLFVSAQRQINRALELFGITHESTETAAVIIAERQDEVIHGLDTIASLISGTHDDMVIELTDEKLETIKRLFGISDLEIESKSMSDELTKDVMINLVIEHVALLATKYR